MGGGGKPGSRTQASTAHFLFIAVISSTIFALVESITADSCCFEMDDSSADITLKCTQITVHNLPPEYINAIFEKLKSILLGDIEL